MNTDLSNRVTLVIGGTRGIGAAVVRLAGETVETGNRGGATREVLSACYYLPA